MSWNLSYAPRINHWKLFNAESSLYIYIRYIYEFVKNGFMAYQTLWVT